MSSEKITFIHELRSQLCYHNTIGLEVYPDSKEITAFLQTEYPIAKAVSVGKSPSLSEPQRAAEQIPVKVQLDRPAMQGTIAEIEGEIRNCRSCSLHVKRVAPVPGSGGEAVRLLLVGGWLTASPENAGEQACIFGRKEDQMLSRMLQAIHLPPGEAFITNLIKCGIDASVQPKSENIDACVSYLYRQISALSPEVICTMGIVATRTLLQSSKPLSQLRGRFHEYSIDQERKIAVMPTYHPSFLLKTPEMKMATWNDLQLVEKRLKVRRN